VGRENSVHFTTLSYSRVQPDEAAGDQAEVGYFLGPCVDPFQGDDNSQCLFRRITPVIDDDVTEGGTAVPLVSHVKSLSLRYLPPDSMEWEKEWDTRGKIREVQRGVFPVAVEATLVITEPRNPKAELSLTLVASVRYPNNPAPKTKAAPESKNTVNKESSVEEQINAPTTDPAAPPATDEFGNPTAGADTSGGTDEFGNPTPDQDDGDGEEDDFDGGEE
jgi:hypothetical protein